MERAIDAHNNEKPNKKPVNRTKMVIISITGRLFSRPLKNIKIQHKRITLGTIR